MTSTSGGYTVVHQVLSIRTIVPFLPNLILMIDHPQTRSVLNHTNDASVVYQDPLPIHKNKAIRTLNLAYHNHCVCICISVAIDLYIEYCKASWKIMSKGSKGNEKSIDLIRNRSVGLS